SRSGIQFWKIPEAKRHIILLEGSDGPFKGNTALEETVEQAAAVLHVSDLKNHELPVGAGHHFYPAALAFDFKPVPDVTGRTRLQAFTAHVILPFKERPSSTAGEAAPAQAQKRQ